MVDKCHLSFQSHQYAIERDLEGNPPTIEDEDFEGSQWKPLVSPPLQTFHWLPSAYRALKRVALEREGGPFERHLYIAECANLLLFKPEN